MRLVEWQSWTFISTTKYLESFISIFGNKKEQPDPVA